ncbi:AAA family ATPase [Candidatus Saccharibacteria bacterium]|nr:AAA family ATPase [Candidatus Saccharibacteria bacterium]
MRIAFTGKGGSGKTTVCSLFARRAAQKGRRVLALDADINQHLAAALGIGAELPGMGSGLGDIAMHLRGDNPRFDAAAMHKTTPPGSGSRFVTLRPDDWFIERYTRSAEGLMVAGAGDIPAENIGVKCYHGLNGAVELVLGHMLDREDEYVLVDMTAGADAFSSSIFTKVDAIVLVVEATQKSLSVYHQFGEHLASYEIPLIVVANKVEDDEDITFIKETVGTVSALFGL